MEESEKRRVRLKAMRMEASQSGDYSQNSIGSSTSLGYGSLTNPLIDSPSSQVEPYAMATSRFDFYTDPMSAFSANKRSNNVNPQVSQQCFTPQVSQQCLTPPRPRYPQSPICNARGNYSVDQTPQPQGVHTFSPLGNPGQNSPFGTPQRSSPNAWGSSFGTPNNYFPPNSSTGGNFGNPSFGTPGFHYGQGRGQPNSGYRGSPYQGSGQGRSQWRGNSSSPVSFQSGGGSGRGSSHGYTSAESRPNRYYLKSMVEDPWKDLKPVIWRNPNSKKSWLPQSISAKKAKLPDAPVKSVPQQSLAEYLSASFNEAAGSEAGNDGSDS